MNKNIEAAAKAIYRLMPGAEAHPWVDGGNSLKQDEARRYARAALDTHQSAPVVESIEDYRVVIFDVLNDNDEECDPLIIEASRAINFAKEPGWLSHHIEPVYRLIDAGRTQVTPQIARKAALWDYFNARLMSRSGIVLHDVKDCHDAVEQWAQAHEVEQNYKTKIREAEAIALRGVTIHTSSPTSPTKAEVDARIALLVQVDELCSQIENSLYAFRDDAEARTQAEGSIAYAKKVAHQYRTRPTVSAVGDDAQQRPLAYVKFVDGSLCVDEFCICTNKEDASGEDGDWLPVVLQRTPRMDANGKQICGAVK